MSKTDNEKLRAIYSNMSQYKLTLAIIDHIREIEWLYMNDYKAKNNPDKLNRELVDLYVLLDILFQEENDFIKIYQKRIDKFYDKSTNEKRRNGFG